MSTQHRSGSPSTAFGEAPPAVTTALVPVPVGTPALGGPLRSLLRPPGLVSARDFAAARRGDASPDQRAGSFYSPSLLASSDFGMPVRYALEQAFRPGGRLYLRGETSGVGTSILMADYCSVFNAEQEACGVPARAVTVKLFTDCRNARQFMDALCVGVNTRISGSDLYRRSHEYLAKFAVHALQTADVGVLVLDHVARVSEGVRAMIASLMIELDSAYRVDAHAAAGLPEAAYNPAVIIVDRQPLEMLVRHSPGIAAQLRGRVATLPRYRKLSDVAEALAHAHLGLDDCSLDDPEDLALCEVVLGSTSGLAVNMRQLVDGLWDVATRLGARPTAAHARAVLQYQPMRLGVRTTKVPARDDVRAQTIAIEAGASVDVPAGRQCHGEHEPERPDMTESTPRGTRAERLAEQEASRRAARKEQRGLLRRDHVNLPALSPDDGEPGADVHD